MVSVRIRAPREDELDRLRAIEVDAARRFAELGMDDVAAMPPQSRDALERARDSGHLWVAELEGAPIAMALTALLDGAPHLAELDVAVEHAGRGIGRALIDHVIERARAAGHTTLTLHTFRDVPWNAPYYARLGFELLEPDAMGPELREATEADRACFGAAPRVCMRRRL
jgi:GNAT superfamily N-acetyltransferase